MPRATIVFATPRRDAARSVAAPIAAGPTVRQGDMIDRRSAVEGYKVVSAVRGKRVGRIVDRKGAYYIVRRSLRRRRYPLPMDRADVEYEHRRVVMRLSRQKLFSAPEVRRAGELDPATDRYYASLDQGTTSTPGTGAPD
jgi:hypothetical protein